MHSLVLCSYSHDLIMMSLVYVGAWFLDSELSTCSTLGWFSSQTQYIGTFAWL